MEANFPLSFNNKLAPENGRVLVSEPFLDDPSFQRSVVLLAEHNEEGSLGFILNKEIDVTIEEAIKGFPKCDTTLFYGGPVCRDQLFYIHTIGEEVAGATPIKDKLYWGGDFEIVKQLIVNGRATKENIRFYIGYSGWSEGQLEKEIVEKSWIVTEPNLEQLLQSQDSSSMWSSVLDSLGSHYSIMANFPEDPSLN